MPTLIARFDPRKTKMNVLCLVQMLCLEPWQRHYAIMTSCQPGEASIHAPFPRGRRGGTERWYALPKVIQLLAGRAGIPEQVGLHIPRPDEEVQTGFSWNVGTDLDWTHFYEEYKRWDRQINKCLKPGSWRPMHCLSTWESLQEVKQPESQASKIPLSLSRRWVWACAVLAQAPGA